MRNRLADEKNLSQNGGLEGNGGSIHAGSRHFLEGYG
jgi:hypothetical protein